MARHNRDGQGVDQRGFTYAVSYQPDWLRQVKVTRDLESGRQSTKTLFRNPANTRAADPGERIRARVVSAEQGLDVEVGVIDPAGCVKRIRVTCVRPGPDGRDEEIEFSFDDRLPPPRD